MKLHLKLIFIAITVIICGLAGSILDARIRAFFYTAYPDLAIYENAECGMRFKYPRGWEIRKHHYGLEKDVCSIEVLEPTEPDYPGSNRRITIHFSADGGHKGYILAWYGDCERSFIEKRDRESLDKAIQWKDEHCPNIHAYTIGDLLKTMGIPDQRLTGLNETHILLYSGGIYYLQSGERIIEIDDPGVKFGEIIPMSFEFTQLEERH